MLTHLIRQPGQVGRAPQRRGENGALGRLHDDLHAERLGNDEDVAEDDRRVQVRVPVDRLESELARKLGLAAALEEGVVLADLKEF